jgi:hypothetical protein
VFDERVPPESGRRSAAPANRSAAWDPALLWAAALGVPRSPRQIEALLRRLFALDRAHLDEQLAAYRRRDLADEKFARWIEVDLEPNRLLKRAGSGRIRPCHR